MKGAPHCAAGPERPPFLPGHLWRTPQKEEGGCQVRQGLSQRPPGAKPNQSPRGWAPERKSDPGLTCPTGCDSLPASLPASSPVHQPDGIVLSHFQHLPLLSVDGDEPKAHSIQPSAPRPCLLPPAPLAAVQHDGLLSGLPTRPTPLLPLGLAHAVPSARTLFPQLFTCPVPKLLQVSALGSCAFERPLPTNPPLAQGLRLSRASLFPP